MRHGALLVTLFCLGGLTVQAADHDTYQKPKPAVKKPASGWPWWPFGSWNKKTPPKKEPPKIEAEVKVQAIPSTPKPVNENASLAKQEYENFIRRQAACDKLRTIALETNDRQLELQAQMLEQRAWSIYQQRTGQAQIAELLPIDESAAIDRLLKRKPSADTATGGLAPDPRMSERPVRSVTASDPGSPERRTDP